MFKVENAAYEEILALFIGNGQFPRNASLIDIKC